MQLPYGRTREVQSSDLYKTEGNLRETWTPGRGRGGREPLNIMSRTERKECDNSEVLRNLAGTGQRKLLEK